jgi:hypothetical protein
MIEIGDNVKKEFNTLIALRLLLKYENDAALCGSLNVVVLHCTCTVQNEEPRFPSAALGTKISN